MFELRGYQQQLVAEAEGVMTAGGVPCIVCPTGGGKTVILAELARLAIARGERVVIVAHRQEIILQITGSLRKHLGSQVGIEVVTAGTRARWNRQITVGMVPTLARRLQHLAPLRGCTLIADECHHAGAASWAKVAHALAPARRAGLTATPIRPNGKGLGDEGGFTQLLIGPQPDELMAWGNLCRYKLFASPAAINADGLKKRGGDFITSEVERRVVAINGQIVPDWVRLNPTRASTITVAVSVAHAHELVELYRAAGIAAACVDGKTPKGQRDLLFRRFRNGELTVMVACAVIDEGLDVPEATVLQVTRPTASLRLWKQLVGRVLRPADGKDHAVIIDHTDNWKRLPLPDAPVKWELNSARQAIAQRRQLELDPVTNEVVVGPVVEIESTGAQLVEITPDVIANANPRTARRLFNERLSGELRQVKEGRLEVEALRPWLQRVAMLERGNLQGLAAALGLGDRWVESQLMLTGLVPASMTQATKAAQADWGKR